MSSTPLKFKPSVISDLRLLDDIAGALAERTTDAATKTELQSARTYFQTRIKELTSTAPAEPSPGDDSALTNYLQSAKWSDYRSGTGSWIFAADPSGNIYPELKTLVNRIKESNSKQVVIGSFTYKVSRGQTGGLFLSRYKTSKGS
ncbi:MAG: hypothetical protein M1503_03565 [Thaumarchaeota archaeon]|nr:hypothetical protein [Nitrososphaerota archaeon]MCL5317331.1 hypothetical protein [Nitrososphaerota archaeon]